MAFTLPRLPQGDFSPLELQLWWQQVVEAIEAQENSQNDILAQLASQEAQLASQLAQIEQAQTDATAAAREVARINSYPNPGGILHAADAGTNATITIDNHTRVYPVEGVVDVPDVAITGGTITGVTSGVRVWVYYVDTTLANPTPTFLWTTNSALAQVGAAAGNHLVGFIDTPAAGSSGTSSGTGGGTPGGGGGGGSFGGSIP